jgi:23S rRNA-/tRNA-specific pseudouridylate synthase
MAMSKDIVAKGSAATDNKWRFEAVPDHEDGTRLDRFLRRLFPGLGQGQIERMLRNGLIRLDGAKAKAATRLASGQTAASSAGDCRNPCHQQTCRAADCGQQFTSPAI